MQNLTKPYRFIVVGRSPASLILGIQLTKFAKTAIIYSPKIKGNWESKGDKQLACHFFEYFPFVYHTITRHSGIGFERNRNFYEISRRNKLRQLRSRLKFLSKSIYTLARLISAALGKDVRKTMKLLVVFIGSLISIFSFRGVRVPEKGYNIIIENLEKSFIDAGGSIYLKSLTTELIIEKLRNQLITDEKTKILVNDGFSANGLISKSSKVYTINLVEDLKSLHYFESYNENTFIKRICKTSNTGELLVECRNENVTRHQISGELIDTLKRFSNKKFRIKRITANFVYRTDDTEKIKVDHNIYFSRGCQVTNIVCNYFWIVIPSYSKNYFEIMRNYAKFFFY